MIKVLIAEDQVLIQKDICKKIEKSEKNVEIAGTAMNGQDAYEKILTLHPDILITDIRMPIQTAVFCRIILVNCAGLAAQVILWFRAVSRKSAAALSSIS